MKNNSFKYWGLAILAVVGAYGAVQVFSAEKPEPAVTVSVDPRVEMMAIIFRLAGNKEYGESDLPSYARDVDDHFAPFKNHPVVKLAARLAKEKDNGYDAPMRLAVHFTDTASFGEKVPFSAKPEMLFLRWSKEDLDKFIPLARDFARKSDFNGFYAAHQPLYDLAVQRMRAVMKETAHLDWFPAFFGPADNMDFRVVLGMMNGGNSYGPKVILPGGHEEIYAIIGVSQADKKGEPVFPEWMMGTITHEFGHSYVNPLVDRFSKELKSPGRKLYAKVEDQMKAQAYGVWTTVVVESVNRACVLRYQLANYGPKYMEKSADRDISRGFYWVPGLADLLGKYEAEPRKYKDLGEFFPQIVAYLNDYAAHYDQHMEAIKAEADVKRRKEEEKMAAWKEKGPKIVSMSPANGAADVPADINAIVIKFDRPMSQGFSMLNLRPNSYPVVRGNPHYDVESKVLTVNVKLEPGKEYVIGLNNIEYNSFRSADGVPLYPVVYTFKTKS